MSPAPETVRRNSTSSSSLSISTILSRAPRISNESPPPGPFSADRRTSLSYRRREHLSDLRPPNPFYRVSQPALTSGDRSAQGEDAEGGLTRAMLLSALETRRRRIERLQMDPRPQPESRSLPESEGWTPSIPSTFQGTYDDREEERFPTPFPRIPWRRPAHRGIVNVESSESDSDDDDDPENKIATSINVGPTTPTRYQFQESSPANQSTAPTVNDDDSSRSAYTLSCRFCANVLTRRGMRARLVADARVHIWSTDEQPWYIVIFAVLI